MSLYFKLRTIKEKTLSLFSSHLSLKIPVNESRQSWTVSSNISFRLHNKPPNLPTTKSTEQFILDYNHLSSPNLKPHIILSILSVMSQASKSLCFPKKPLTQRLRSKSQPCSINASRFLPPSHLLSNLI